MTTGAAPSLLDIARSYWEAGLTPMPRVPGDPNPHCITATGEIRPIGWGHYKVQQPPWSTVKRWFRRGSLATVGVTLLTGSHAQPRSPDAAFLQILDIETRDLLEAFLEEVNFLGSADILHRCVIERSAGEGGHLGFLCATIGDKQKIPLARRADQKLLIELLQHQPCTVAPTTIRCKEEHADGACYTLLKGTWAQPQVISTAQRQILLDVARRYTEVPEQVAAEPGEHMPGTRPGDLLNERADIDWWQELLLRHGWRDVSRPGWARRGVYYFQRPGKQGREPSATYGNTGPSLYVFSSNAQPFEPDTAYKPFAAYTLLEHAGDYKAAALSLAKRYGLEMKQAPTPDLHHHRNGSTPGPEPPDPNACPELPASAKVNEEFAAGASLFLDEYIAFSKTWAPRAYEGFHEAGGLFTLSTTAAHRVKIELGPHGVYTSLYMALAARTSLFTKTTAVDIALALLHRAGLFHLLADDDATPQAFLRSLTLHIPPDYAELPSDAQQALRERLAFAGQKGWFYEEWGQHLHAMMQKEGQMAAFRSILRRLDDHKDAYVYSTIARGRDVLIKPYVALLANVTPADLKPFMRAQSPLWRDGYIARFAFIAPGEVEASTAAFPEDIMRIPKPLITTLANWHKRLGIPQIAVEPIMDEKKKATGRYRPVWASPHKETTYRLSPEVRKAFYAYDEAIHALMTQSKNEDLDGSYARFPMKALRIAGLLASLHDDSGRYTIWPAQWYRGQQIAERWRQDLHKLIKQVSEGEAVTRESKAERRILDVLKQHGALTIRDINRWSKMAHGEILQCLKVLCEAGVVQETTTPRTTKYQYTLDGDATSV